MAEPIGRKENRENRGKCGGRARQPRRQLTEIECLWHLPPAFACRCSRTPPVACSLRSPSTVKFVTETEVIKRKAMTGTAMRALLCALLLLSLAGAVADAAEGEAGKAEDGSCASTEVRPDGARRAPKRWEQVARGGVRCAAAC